MSFAFLSRRRLLKLGLAAGGLVAAGAGGLMALRGSAPPVEGLRALSAHEHRTLANIARAQIPRGGAFDLGADDFELCRTFDAFLAAEPAKNVADLKKALFLVELGPVVFERRLVTFSNLDAAEREAHWRAWSESDELLRRQVAIAFRKFLSLVFYDQPPVWAHIGYPGPATGLREG